VHIRPIRPADEAEFLREGLELVLRYACGSIGCRRASNPATHVRSRWSVEPASARRGWPCGT
jgi:hypothetical protein